MKKWHKIDFLSGEVHWLETYRDEDMLMVVYPNNYILDMGWYEGINKYVIYIIKDNCWGVPVAKYSAEKEDDIVLLLQEATEKINYESQNSVSYYGKLWTTEVKELQKSLEIDGGYMAEYIKMLDKINSKKDFLKFMELYLPTVAEATVKEYLESVTTWVEDMDGYYKNTNKEEPQNINWNFIATLIYVGSIYE